MNNDVTDLVRALIERVGSHAEGVDARVEALRSSTDTALARIHTEVQTVASTATQACSTAMEGRMAASDREIRDLKLADIAQRDRISALEKERAALATERERHAMELEAEKTRSDRARETAKQTHQHQVAMQQAAATEKSRRVIAITTIIATVIASLLSAILTLATGQRTEVVAPEIHQLQSTEVIAPEPLDPP